MGTSNLKFSYFKVKIWFQNRRVKYKKEEGGQSKDKCSCLRSCSSSVKSKHEDDDDEDHKHDHDEHDDHHHTNDNQNNDQHHHNHHHHHHHHNDHDSMLNEDHKPKLKQEIESRSDEGSPNSQHPNRMFHPASITEINPALHQQKLLNFETYKQEETYNSKVTSIEHGTKLPKSDLYDQIPDKHKLEQILQYEKNQIENWRRICLQNSKLPTNPAEKEVNELSDLDDNRHIDVD